MTLTARGARGWWHPPDAPASALLPPSTRGNDCGVVCTAPVRVVVVDDQAAFRTAARRLLEHSAGFELVGESDTGGTSVDLVEVLRPDLVLMDIKLPDISGIEATQRIIEVSPRSTVVLLSTYPAGDLPTDVAASGARAYLHKEDLTPSVLAAVLSGEPSRATLFG